MLCGTKWLELVKQIREMCQSIFTSRWIKIWTILEIVQRYFKSFVITEVKQKSNDFDVVYIVALLSPNKTVYGLC